MKTAGIIIFILSINTSTAFAQRPPIISHAWAYQLQRNDVVKIAENKTFDLIVMDYSTDGSADAKYSSSDIAKIRQSGKKTFAYISIGEAESYRSYWKSDWSQTPPVWLGPENPQWPGNFKVRFWYPEWQNIVFDYIKDIYSQGFDGIYCDIIDAYYYWKTEHPEEPKADSLMIQFIVNIRSLVATLGTRAFYIIPQNGESILHEENITNDLRKNFFNAIDAIGVEDVFFHGTLEENNLYNPEISRFSNLQEFLDNNKPVLSIEYLTKKSLIDEYVPHAHDKGYVPYCNVRKLDTLFDGILAENSVDGTSKLEPIVTQYNIDGSITIVFRNQECKQILLYDMFAKETDIMFQPNSPLCISKELLHLPRGIYFLKIIIAQTAYYKKIVLL